MKRLHVIFNKKDSMQVIFTKKDEELLSNLKRYVYEKTGSKRGMSSYVLDLIKKDGIKKKYY